MSKEFEGAPFVVKTYQLVTDATTNHLVSWSGTQDSFIVWKPVDFAADVLPQYFKHNNFCSFIRQLNTYGFHKVDGKLWEFKHDLFQQGQPQLLKDISRRKSKKRGSDKDEFPESPPEDKTTSSPPSNLVNIKTEPDLPPAKVDKKSDLEKDEVDKLKDINNVLMREVLRLQQQQESTYDVVNQIMEQLMESKKEQHHLHKKVALLTKEVATQLPNSVSLISPPPSPLHPAFDNASKNHILSPPFFVSTFGSEPLTQPTMYPTTYTTNNTAQRSDLPLESFLGDETGLLGLDNLAHLDLTPTIDQELARMLQQTLSPPQSPAHQGNY